MNEPGDDARHCALCGGPNRCSLALPLEERPAECWCVKRTFPAGLTARADASACICQNCLEKYQAENPQR